MTFGRSPGPVLLAGAAVLAVAFVTPTAAPLYDGIGFPDEPYRYVQRPPGDTRVTKPPGSITTTVTAAYGLNNQAVVGSSDEQSAQVGLYLPRGSLATAMSTTALTVRVLPLVPALQPTAGVVTGNAYAITVTGPQEAVTTTPAAVDGVVMMRASLGSGFTFEYLPDGGSALQTLTTQQVSGDRYQTRFAGLGTYSLAQLPPSKTPAGKGFPVVPLGIAALVLAVLSGIVVAVRRSRQSAPTG